MPNIPMRKCSKPGCRALVSGSYCAAHQPVIKRPDETARPSAAKRGYGRPWQKYSKAFLAAHPLCVICEASGKLTPSAVVDHIVPHRGDKKLFWDKSNHQAACKQCHDRKTAREVGFAGRHRG